MVQSPAKYDRCKKRKRQNIWSSSLSIPTLVNHRFWAEGSIRSKSHQRFYWCYVETRQVLFQASRNISKTFFSNGNTIEVDEATRQLLAGEAYLSLDRIPPEFLQKPAKLQNRHSDEKFKVIFYLEVQSNHFLGRSRLLQTNIQCWVQAQTTGKKSTRSGKKAKTRPSLVTFMSIWLSNHSPRILSPISPFFVYFIRTHTLPQPLSFAAEKK